MRRAKLTYQDPGFPVRKDILRFDVLEGPVRRQWTPHNGEEHLSQWNHRNCWKNWGCFFCETLQRSTCFQVVGGQVLRGINAAAVPVGGPRVYGIRAAKPAWLMESEARIGVQSATVSLAVVLLFFRTSTAQSCRFVWRVCCVYSQDSYWGFDPSQAAVLEPLSLRLQGLAEKPPRFGRSAMRQACALLKVGLNAWAILEAYDSYGDVRYTGWWFRMFFGYHPYLGQDSNFHLNIFLKWVKTTTW